MAETEYAFAKDHRVDQLGAELKTTFGSALVTLRSKGTDPDTLRSASGKVVHDGTLSGAAIQAVVDAHTPVATNYTKMRAAGVAAAILALEAGTATNAQVQNVLAKVLRYLRNETVN